MFELGVIPIRRAASVLEARNKVLGLCRALEMDPITASRVSAAASEMSRFLLREGGEPCIGVSVRADGGSPALVLDYRRRGGLSPPGGLASFFDEMEKREWEDGYQGVRSIKRLRVPVFVPSEEFLQQQRERIRSLSRDDLMEELRGKNEELERHGEQLEEMVAERTKELVQAQQEADRANLAKSEFLSNMSHELRTPLNGVLGYAQILQRDRGVTKRQRETLQAIENCGQHLLTLINDVLDLSKIEAGRMEIEFEAVHLKRLLESVRDIVRPRAESKGLSFTLEIAPEVPEGILADATKLKQILVNLLGNSLKFTEEGSVGLKVEVSEGHLLHFIVSDTGLGMMPEELEEVFDAFKQAKGGKTSGGTGLGLPISRRMAEAMGGTLEAESEPGRGSAFTLTLPVVVVDAEEGEEEAPRLTEDSRPVLAPGQEVTILVVDDGRENRDILVRLLEGAGFRAVEAVHGAQALEKLETEEIALTLMDIRMPVMDGIEALKRIRADERLAGHPVVAVSASVIGRQKEEVEEANFDAFVAKPFRVSEVFGVIETILGVQYSEDAEEETGAGARPADAGEAVPMPADLAREIAGRLREATGVGDITAVTALAEELEGRPGVHPALPEEIQGLAMAFDFDGLNGLADRIERQAEQERA